MKAKKLTLITGASSGIGEACAVALAEQGHDLILLARRQRRLQVLADRLKQSWGVTVTTIAVDVGNHQELAAALAPHQQSLSKVNTLINNAGLARGLSPFYQGELADWQEMMQTNVMGLLYVSRLIAPHLIAKGDGHIVNVGSIAGRQSYPNGNVYCASKAAVRMLNESMRLDLLGKGVRVTSIDPGLVQTEFSLVRFHGDANRAKTPYQGMTPLAAKDVAEAILWAINRPPHVNVQEILLMPTDQASATMVNRFAID